MSTIGKFWAAALNLARLPLEMERARVALNASIIDHIRKAKAANPVKEGE